jgi:hypothetical protein
VIEAYGTEVLDIAVEDPGVIADLNTPEELWRWLGGKAS